jgi:hypothetical protein
LLEQGFPLVRKAPRAKMKGQAVYLQLLLSFLSVTLTEGCLADDEANTTVSRWTLLAMKIDIKMVKKTVVDHA